jgi:hypothetical protein
MFLYADARITIAGPANTAIARHGVEHLAERLV